MAAPSFYWHDYETFGADPASDRPVQFAGIRTTADLEESGEPLLVYCRPPDDYLPQPDACLITGITPQTALEHGLTEREFIGRIAAEFGRPGTCGVGYNSIRFDDEFTRHALWRNFFDPYEREYRHGNSRWDLIDVLRMAHALRPEGIAWPRHADGRPSFRLQDLSAANGIAHENAHDALSDVRATIALARLLRERQPKLWEHALRARDKQWVKTQLDTIARKPMLHVSSRFPAEQGNLAVVVPLALHPQNANSVIACNLGLDPEPLLRLDATTLRKHLYMRAEELPAGASRVPLKEIHANKSPMLAPLATLTPELAARWGIDLPRCMANLERVNAAPGLAATLREVFADRTPRPAPDAEGALYAGGFLGDADRALCARVRAADGAELARASIPFADERLAAMLPRYRARNFPATLTADERAEWREHCARRLAAALPAFEARIATLRAERAGDADAIAVLDRLAEHAAGLVERAAATGA